MPVAGAMSVINGVIFYTFAVLGIFISALIAFVVAKIKGYTEINAAIFFGGWLFLLVLLLLIGYFAAASQFK